MDDQEPGPSGYRPTTTQPKHLMIGDHRAFIQEQQINKKVHNERSKTDKQRKTSRTNIQQRLEIAKGNVHTRLGKHAGFQNRPTQNQDPRRQNITNAHSNNKNHSEKGKFIGFKGLQELADLDKGDILKKLDEKTEGFFNLLQNQIDRVDVFVLIIEIMAKVCKSSFDQMVSKLLIDVCNSNFIGNLRIYLMDLPDAQQKKLNNLYWKNQNQFWINFITVFEYIVDVLPSLALVKCKSLITATTAYSLDRLKNHHQFTLSDEYYSKLNNLQEKLTLYENERKEEVQRKSASNSEDHIEPPENFRLLSILPTREELLDTRPFLRKNIIEGGYKDVEHYLDVQFRLLREDCFGPLREGILQYMKEPTKERNNNIRVYKNVKFTAPYISKSKDRSGYLIQIDPRNCKHFKNIRWAHNKRFIYGSLLLFTKDECRNFIVATILDRDIALLVTGQIPVSIFGSVITENMFTGDSYLMIESQVYFEPYFHILKVLQDPKFPANVAMTKYIVKMEPEPRPPAYLNEKSEFYVRTINSEKINFKVLQEPTWPTAEELGLNNSQYEAYKLALTHEFAVIQGPPGTGKTFLGVKVAQTLIKNVASIDQNCLMLVICYTNHALDQFLEALLPITDSVVRIGGQSRSEEMEKYNINNFRRDIPEKHHFYREARFELKNSIIEMQKAQKLLNDIYKVILRYDCVQTYAPESRILSTFYEVDDPLIYWLFEGTSTINFESLILEDIAHQNSINKNVNDIDEDIDHSRNEIILDDIADEFSGEINYDLVASFSIDNEVEKLHRLIKSYKSSKNNVEQMRLQEIIMYMKSCIDLFIEMNKTRKRKTHLKLDCTLDLSIIPLIDRWSLYFRWVNIVKNKFKQNMEGMQKNLLNNTATYEEARMLQDVLMLKNRKTKVVGMTTSGAARFRKLLQELAPPIVIVEEAAEVLEAHIVTSLTKDCEHLILIGDHQQLRPSAAYMKLARHFNMEVSLFERMIVNSVHSRRLAVQHRMRPEIAALISPHIYPDLENHPSVENYPRIRGMTANLFFLSHDHKEEEVDENSSRTNRKEGDLTLALANYLMQQGYEGDDVTILAAYSGQMFYMRNQRQNYSHLERVKITVVDNYQGEESKIILLSLVRNNDQNSIGFLGIKNRICVALSRAKEGFYIFGNMDMLKNNELWNNIAATLDNKEAIGNNLKLQCENHADTITVISAVEDFKNVPEGGCMKKCPSNLSCGHPCTFTCHGYDRDHKKIKCKVKCERILCELEHVCPLPCARTCNPCAVPVEKELPCGHRASVSCHVAPEAVKCHTKVFVTLPACGHTVEKRCYNQLEEVRCPVPCDTRVESCGHACQLSCHVTKDPHHEEYMCLKPCARPKKNCSVELDGDRGDHQCRKLCYEDCDPCNVQVTKKRSTCTHTQQFACGSNIDLIHCLKKCTRALPCKHFCKKKCFEKCGDCTQMVEKEIAECGHKVQFECGVEARREHCCHKCERTLSCGHPCGDLCARPCDVTNCTHILLDHTLDAACGHKVAPPCNINKLLSDGVVGREVLLQHCTVPCDVKLLCGHACPGTCAACRQGRLHVPCTAPCGANNVCGHQCSEPCNQMCPPCNKQCPVKCPHARCGKLCGAPCIPCQEKCVRPCVHVDCSQRCGEQCGKQCAPAPVGCSRRCTRTLQCGHTCRGLCGEPCVDACRLCSPDTFPVDFLGDHYEDDDILIKLEDCSHVFSVNDMDTLVKRDDEIVKLPACPRCRTPIINTHRYKDIINDILKREINPIKEKVYGNLEEIKRKKLDIFNKISTLNSQRELYIEVNWRNALRNMVIRIKRERRPSLLHLNMHLIKLNILEIISDSYKKYMDRDLINFKEELVDQIKMLCNIITTCAVKISEQQQTDIGRELKRLNAIIQFANIVQNRAYIIVKTQPIVTEATALARNSVFTQSVFDETRAIETLLRLQEAIKATGIVTVMERQLVVQAMGTKAGHWYKCRNGHPYYIGDCGGANQVSKCIECGAPVGGTSHRLLAGNAHAGEVDGSSFPAWSEEYNNMANFHIE